MNPSAILKRFLNSGKQPTSQRESAALLDESRGLLLSKLPTTGETIMNFTTDELATVNLKGGNVLDEMHKVYLEKQGKTPARPTAKPVATAPARRNPAARPAATTRPARSAAAPMAPSAPSATITAKEFVKPDQSMTLSEFNKMKPAEKMRFVKSGGKIV